MRRFQRLQLGPLPDGLCLRSALPGSRRAGFAGIDYRGNASGRDRFGIYADVAIEKRDGTHGRLIILHPEIKTFRDRVNQPGCDMARALPRIQCRDRRFDQAASFACQAGFSCMIEATGYPKPSNLECMPGIVGHAFVYAEQVGHD